MSQSGEAAEQIVNMATNVTVKGVECATNLAGRGALSLATFLIAALKDQKRTSGKARMRAFNGKPTKVFVLKAKDMKTFAEEAKKYGVLYAAVINKKQPDGLIDVVVNANDAAKVNRIAERFALSTVDVERIHADIEKARAEREPHTDGEKTRAAPPDEKAARTVTDAALDDHVPQKTEHRQPTEVSEKAANPTMPGTERSAPSARSSASRDASAEENISQRRSVREQIRDIRQERQPQPARERARQTIQPQPQRKRTKSKGR